MKSILLVSSFKNFRRNFFGSKPTFFTLVCVFLSSFYGHSANWYASPTGSGTGSLSSPLDLQAAFNSLSIAPGDILYLLPGRYVGRYVCNINGTAARYIRVMPYSGEVILDGNNFQTGFNSPPILEVKSSYVEFSDFEITYSRTVRKSGARGFNQVDGIFSSSGVNCRYINLSIHDVPGTGVATWKGTAAAYFYGCMIYNNGWFTFPVISAEEPGHGPGMYVQNADCTYRKIENNIIFNNFKIGLEVWSASGTATFPYVQNIHLHDNTVFNSGSPYQGNSNQTNLENILVKTMDVTGNNSPKNIYVTKNALYHNTDYTINGSLGLAVSLQIGSVSQTFPAQNMFVKDNFISGRNNSLIIYNNANMTFQNNYTLGRYLVYSSNPNMLASGWQFDNNKYYGRFSNYFRQMSPLSDMTLADWQANNGIDLNSTFHPFALASNSQVNNPPRVLQITQNKYQPKKFKVVVFNAKSTQNPNGNSLVDVDLSAWAIPVGSKFKVYDVQNSRTSGYALIMPASKIVTLNLAGSTSTFLNPISSDGYVSASAHTPDNFGVFSIECGSAVPYLNVNYNVTLQNDCFATPVDDFKPAKKVILFPNPSSDFMNIKIQGEKMTRVVVYSINDYGMLIDLPMASQEEYKLDISQLKSETYLLTVETDEGVIFSEKFIKK